MIQKKPKFHRSLMGKMLLFAALPTAIVLFVVSFYTAQKMYSGLLALHEKNIQISAQDAADDIDRRNLEAVTIVKTMAIAQEAGMFGNRKLSSEYAKQILEANPQYTGAYFGYEPNADQDDRAYLQTVGDDKGGLDPSGRFIPYWFFDLTDHTTVRLNPLKDMDTSLYYNGLKEKFLAGSPEPYMITEPYIYEGKLIYEQTYPIVVDGQFRGIAGLDRALHDMEEYLREQAKEYEVDLILISRMGKIISATMDPSLKTKPLAQTPYQDILAKFHENRVPDHELMMDPVNHDEYYFASCPIKTGQWTLVVRVPQSLIVDDIKATIRNVAIFSFLAMVLVLGLIIYSARAVTRSIRKAVDAAEKVATGDLVCELVAVETDETGQLLSAIQVMTHDLNSVVREVINASIRLTSTATQLSATSREQERTVATFGSSTTEITAAVKQISATSQELVTTMSDVAQVSSETATLANSGRSVLGEMVGSMEQLAAATDGLSAKLAAIRESADDINIVVTTITKVADQTNLLSINAAIEAEKAGEYGSGFLVVAREIRRLADQTAVATLDIEQMVREMHGAVGAGVGEVERFAQRVSEAAEDAGRVRDKLEKIIEQVEILTPQFDNVNEGMRSQSQGAEQIRDAMVQLSEGARQSASTVHEFNKAGDHLHQAVDGLRQAVSRFKVSN
jgi:methyl-accepting chemotaxis protein/cell division protein FtsL